MNIEYSYYVHKSSYKVIPYQSDRKPLIINPSVSYTHTFYFPVFMTIITKEQKPDALRADTLNCKYIHRKMQIILCENFVNTKTLLRPRIDWTVTRLGTKGCLKRLCL